jgi:hypothetical protein
VRDYRGWGCVTTAFAARVLSGSTTKTGTGSFGDIYEIRRVYDTSSLVRFVVGQCAECGRREGAETREMLLGAVTIAALAFFSRDRGFYPKVSLTVAIIASLFVLVNAWDFFFAKADSLYIAALGLMEKATGERLSPLGVRKHNVAVGKVPDWGTLRLEDFRGIEWPDLDAYFSRQD